MFLRGITAVCQRDMLTELLGYGGVTLRSKLEIVSYAWASKRLPNAVIVLDIHVIVEN